VAERFASVGVEEKNRRPFILDTTTPSDGHDVHVQSPDVRG
jgi:hypothetical protein